MQHNSFVVLNENDEVIRGIEGGCQEEPTNIQEEGTKGGSLPHVMHEGLYTYHRQDFRAPNNSRNKKYQEEQQLNQQ